MKVENKFYATNYDLTTPYFKSDFPAKVLVASDVHYQTSVTRDLFTLLVRYARETNPDFIVMSGDQVETIDFIDNSEDKKFFERIIRELSEVAPLLIIPGNNYQPLFKRSESSGFMNFGTNIPNKTKRGNRNDFNRKNLVGISNSLINNGFNYNDKRLFRNASDLFH